MNSAPTGDPGNSGILENADEIVCRHRAILSAATTPGLLGELRRGINAACREPRELAAACGIEAERLEDFRAAEASLSVEEIERLAGALDLHLAPAAAIRLTRQG